MNVLMTLAVVGAIFIGEWTEAATVVFLFAVGTLLESRTMDRARQSIRALMSLTPSTATRLHGDDTESVLVEDLSVGDRILIRPGEALHQSYWQTVHRDKDGMMIAAAMGRSEDRLVKRNGKWLIQERKLTVFTD